MNYTIKESTFCLDVFNVRAFMNTGFGLHGEHTITQICGKYVGTRSLNGTRRDQTRYPPIDRHLPHAPYTNMKTTSSLLGCVGNMPTLHTKCIKQWIIFTFTFPPRPASDCFRRRQWVFSCQKNHWCGREQSFKKIWIQCHCMHYTMCAFSIMLEPRNLISKDRSFSEWNHFHFGISESFRHFVCTIN